MYQGGVGLGEGWIGSAGSLRILSPLTPGDFPPTKLPGRMKHGHVGAAALAQGAAPYPQAGLEGNNPSAQAVFIGVLPLKREVHIAILTTIRQPCMNPSTP